MDQRNLLLAIVVSMAILFAWTFLYEMPRQEQAADRALREQAGALQPPSNLVGPAPRPGTPGAGMPGVVAAPDRAAALAAAARRVPIETPALAGSVNLAGGRLDDLALRDFRRDVAADSPNVVLLSPDGAPHPYFAEFGWLDGSGGRYGLGDAAWRTDGIRLTPATPLVLRWDNGAGLRFTRTYAVDEHFMFTVTQRVTNAGTETVQLFPFGLVRRTDEPDTLGFFILHEGPIGVFNETLDEVDYDDVRDDREIVRETRGGWIGITDKYWLAALVPDQRADLTTTFRYIQRDNREHFQTDYLGAAVTVAPGGTAEVTNRLFAGAKQVELLDGYAEQFGIPSFDMAIDFGWFFFLTKPLLQVLVAFAEFLGNFGLAILLLTVIIKLVFFPLANKSYRSMSKMKALQPKMVELREKFGDDKQKMQQELMALYKREKVNPVSGCLPIAIQIPVFFALYKVIFISIEVRHAPFYGWIRDLSAEDPTSILNLFGLIPWQPPEILALVSIGIWPLIMGVTMWLQMKLNPTPPDPIQAKVFMLMPIVFTFFLAQFPAGLVIYWAWNNLLSIAQQYVIMRSMGVPIGNKQTA